MRIWQKIQDTIIIVQDPKEYARDFGLSVLPEGSLKFRYEGKEFIIEKTDKHFKPLNEMLQRKLSQLILTKSPIIKISFSLSEIPLLSPGTNFFSPEHILSLVDKQDSKKEVMGVIKLAARLCSTFIEVIDPKTRKSILEQFYSYESDFFFLSLLDMILLFS
ncbi:MAG: hypothetical protein ACOC57_02300 [Acidobacteriota bacterium]